MYPLYYIEHLIGGVKNPFLAFLYVSSGENTLNGCFAQASICIPIQSMSDDSAIGSLYFVVLYLQRKIWNIKNPEKIYRDCKSI